MLTATRLENLRKNKDKIFASKLIAMSYEERDLFMSNSVGNNTCCYQYEDGSVCAASACLSDKERSFLSCNPDINSTIISASECKVALDKTSDDELDTMRNFQVTHDAYCNYRGDRQRWLFEKALESMLENGTVNLSEEQIHFSSSAYDRNYSKVGDGWVAVRQ